jgi:copper transport protein
MARRWSLRLLQRMKRCSTFSQFVRLLIAAAAVALAVLFSAPVAKAETLIVIDSSPTDGSALEFSPPSITVTFNLVIGSAATITVTCNGTVAAVPSAKVSTDQFSIVLDLTATPLPAGNCGVDWQAQGIGGLVSSGKFGFSIAQSSAPVAAQPTQTTVAPAPAASSAPEPVADPSILKGPLGLFRLLSMLGLAVFFGALVLIAVAWPEGVEYVVTIRFLRSTWFVAMFGTVAMAACMTAQLTGKTFTASLMPTTWVDLKDSIPGSAALGRLVFCGAAFWVAWKPERAIDPTTQLPALALPGLAVATMGFSRAGGDIALLGYAAGVVHALSMAVWFGGLVLLARVVLSGPGQEDLVHATRGFGRLATPALGLTVVTGLIQMWRLDVDHMTNSGHGQVLILKVIGVAAIVFVGLETRKFVRARLARVDVLTAAMAKRLSRAIGIEAVGGALILLLTAVMLSLQPGKLIADGNGPSNYAFRKQFIDAKGANNLTVYVTPTVVGPNAVYVKLDKPVTGVTAFTITFTPPADQLVPSVVLSPSLTGAGSASLPVESGIPLNAPGAWTMAISILTADGEFRDSAVFNVGATAAVKGATETTSPSATTIAPLVITPVPPATSVAP